MIYLLIFLLGLVVGSFLSLVVYREVKGTKIRRTDKWLNSFKSWLPTWVWGRSFCDNCHYQLSWYDNIPLLSYLCFRGKCRKCHHKISFQYPLIELLTGLEFIWLYWLLNQFSFFGQIEGFYSFALAIYWFFIFSVSLTIALVDLKIQMIPDAILLPATIISILRLFITHQWQFLLSGITLSGFFYTLYLITQKKGIGFGDVKLVFFIGIVLGWWQRIVVAVFLAFLTGAVVGVIVVLSKKKTWKSAISFGPFLLLGLWIAKILGDQIWNWYWHLIN